MKIAIILFGLVAAISACEDSNQSCRGWKSLCQSHPYVIANCKKTCESCDSGNNACKDLNVSCPSWESLCSSHQYVIKNCKKTCGTCGGSGGNGGTGGNGGSGGNGGTGGNNGKCGRPSIAHARVVNGVNAKPGSWPWQIGMFRNGRFHCGGSLVNTKWIVTAAHCVHRMQSSDFKIVLGDHDQNRNERTEQTITARRFVQHPGYNQRRMNNDIALIELASPAKFNNRVQSVCLPSKGEAPSVGSKCTITGWGKIRHPGSSHPILQQLDLGIISGSQCNQMNGKYMRITDQMLCGSNGKNSRQSGCHGDSGGPFVCKQQDGSYKLHGAVSWGSPRCDSRDSNTVFARVAEFRDWIDSYINN